jgi:hypothetical protein
MEQNTAIDDDDDDDDDDDGEVISYHIEVSTLLHAPVALPRKKPPRYPSDRRLGRPQSRSARCGQKDLMLPRIKPEPPSQEPAAIATELSLLLATA